jgi:parvulin-like peptidyl-prolyl isomerase
MRRLSLPVLLLSVPLAVPPAVAETVERVVAKVNGQIITLSDFQARQLDAAQAARVDPANVAAFLRQNNSRILQDAIDEILLLQKAEDAGLKPPDAYLDQVIDQIKKEHNLASQQEFEAALAEQGMSYADLRTIIERRVLREMILRRDIEPKMTVSDADLRREYEQLKGSEFTTPAKITLQEIVVKDDAGGEALAQELAAKARAGEDFAALAKAHSAAPTRAHDGEVGEIAENDMDPDLRKLVLALPVGGVSQPVRIPDGYRIVKVTARTPAVTIPFDVAAEKLRERAMNARFEKEYEVYMQELRKTAQIELRVREVPLQLTGPIPEGSLLEGLDASVSGAPAAAAGTSAQQPAPSAPAAPAGIGDDEIVSSPQTAPQRIAPGGPGAPAPPPEKPRDAAPNP